MVQPTPQLPSIDVGQKRPLRSVSAEALGALTAAHVTGGPRVYVRDGRLVSLVRDESGHLSIQEASENRLRGILERAANFCVRDKDGAPVSSRLPVDVVRDIVALGEWPGLPPIAALIDTPRPRYDGSIVTDPGYDEGSWLYLEPAPGLVVPHIPAAPTAEDVRDAVETLLEPLLDFPFDSEASRVNALALVITPLVRNLIKGRTPLALITKPQAGTGASLLAGIPGAIESGASTAAISLAANGDEILKVITAVLIRHDAVVVFDNVERLGSPHLSALLTSDTFGGRELGRSRILSLPVRAQFIATGNNITLEGDLARRSFLIRLDAKAARPFEGRSFRHPDLEGWVREHRGELIAAALTLVSHWVQSGRPRGSATPWGGFEDWCHVVGGILDAAGINGFLANRDLLVQAIDEEDLLWESFLEAIAENHADEFESRDVVESIASRYISAEVVPPELSRFIGREDDAITVAVGRSLSRVADRRFGPTEIFVTKVGSARRGALRWTVRGCHPDQAPRGSDRQLGPEPGPARHRDLWRVRGSCQPPAIQFFPQGWDHGTHRLAAGGSRDANFTNRATLHCASQGAPICVELRCSMGGEMPEIVWLSDERCTDIAEVGAKAAHLSRLATLHLVPPGFVVTAMEAGNSLNPTLKEQLRHAYRGLAALTRNPATPVAVRSSAIDEDGAGASFAGQHDTYLNVRGEEAVIEAVARCSDSARSATALGYRQERGLITERPQIAVLVQALVQSVASAVVFSANPITGARDEVMITSAWGLGESVVSGSVTPDMFVLRRPQLREVERLISSKEVMTVLVEGGTKDAPVPADIRNRASLDRSRVIEIARLALKLERAMGWPVDVECAVAYDELYLLQCRPITTLPD